MGGSSRSQVERQVRDRSRTISLVRYLVQSLGPRARALAKQDIQWRKGHTLIAQLMTAGEFPLGVIYAHRVEELKQRGAPVEWVNTVNPIVVTVNAGGLS